MQADTASLPADGTPEPGGAVDLDPLPLLRVSTAGGAFAMGLVQTLVFARVLTPDRFSLFILVGAIGYSLWLCDLGLAKILFVQLRTAHLAGKTDRAGRKPGDGGDVFYVLLAAAGSLFCFGFMAARPSFSLLEAADFGLFFFYITLNLTWVCLRSLSIAVDEYVFYESSTRAPHRQHGDHPRHADRAAVYRFSGRIERALGGAGDLRGGEAAEPQCDGAAVARLYRELLAFFQTHMRSIARSGTFALSDIFIYTFPYYVVPWAFGLGAPIIILEATFRIFRGASVIYSAAATSRSPADPRARGARRAEADPYDADRSGACCLPAAFACGLLIFASKQLFAFLLGTAATVPPTVTPILVVMLLANLVQMVAQSLLLHAGFFREISRICAVVAVAMVLATAIAVVAKLTIVEFLGVYAAVYSAGALYLAVAAYRGPILAASPHGVAKWKRAAEPAAAR